MARTRVMVTGIGIICSVAKNRDELIRALREGRRGFVPLDDPRLARLRATHAGLIVDFTPDPAWPTWLAGRDRHALLALAAIDAALVDAGIRGPVGGRGGLVLGTCSGGMLSLEREFAARFAGTYEADPVRSRDTRYDCAAGLLAAHVGARGPVTTVVTACAAGSGALALGADLLRDRQADLVLAGGADAFAPSTLAGFDALKATCEGATTPFSTRIGLNLGEGAAFFVLETLDHAVARGATLLGELLGSGLGNDAHHATAPDPSNRGQLETLGRTLADAGIDSGHIDYVNAHGTGTRANDPIESRTLERLLGERAKTVPVSSTKSMIGHCLGAAGALELAATLVGAHAGITPPTAGFEAPREGCRLDYVPDVGRPWRGRLALSDSFGFAGHDACLVVDTAPGISAPFRPLPEPTAESIVITGIGTVSPLGLRRGPLGAAPPALGALERFPTPVSPFPAGLVPEIDVRALDRRLDLRECDPISRYAVLAARAALEHAGLRPGPALASELGLVLGLALGPRQGEAAHLLAVERDGFVLGHLGAFPYVVPNEVAGHVARLLLLRGHDTVLAAGQGAGLVALVQAATAIRHGHASALLALGADELSERDVADGWRLQRFGPGTGVTPAEGAAALLLERADLARARGAQPLAAITGWSMTAVGEGGRRHEALGRALEEACTRAAIRPTELIAIAGPDPGRDPDPGTRALFAELCGAGLREQSLAPVLGAAEATLPLFNLAGLVASSWTAPIAVTALSVEGAATAIILAPLAGD